MEYLTSEAAKSYYRLSMGAAHYGLVSLTPTMVRLRALRSMCAPGDPTCKVVEEFLLENDFNVDDEWRDDDEKSKDEDSGVQAGSRESVIENRIDEFGNQVAHLWANASTGLAQWEFHQSDPDFFPSIPHGHFMGRRQPKLDAYVGWIYRGAEQIGREPKKKIIALWNDTTFRDFARVP